jgi:hypothetical protein
MSKVSAGNATWVITTLAEYQTEFWCAVCAELATVGQPVFVLSFDDRSADMLAEAGIPHANVYRLGLEAGGGDVEALFNAKMAEYSVENPNLFISHERAAFGIRDTAELCRKFVIYVTGVERALAPLMGNGRLLFIQELGGFLSVLSAFRFALKHGLHTLFIEPSFFRGRMFLRADSLGAPRVSAIPGLAAGQVVRSYLQETLQSRQIVIPIKDRAHYNPVYRKILNLRNVRRAFEKARDKYILGKHQDFGYFGRHVRHHLAMLRNSYRLRQLYVPLPEAGFIYYPLHVPADVALTLRSPAYLDQLALIEFILRTLPPGKVLVIKEHPAQIGSMDVSRMRDLMRRYDNLRLIAPHHNNFGVLERAALVVSVNSKSGAEAMLLGKPVIVLGDAFYADAPFVRKLERLEDLPQAMAASLGQTPFDQDAVAGYFEAVFRATLPGELYVSDPVKILSFTESLVLGAARLEYGYNS